MDTKQLQGLMEAYTQVYAPQNVEEEFDNIGNISDEELLEICEEVICEMIDEGYDLTDCDFLLESENLDEAMGRVRSALSSAMKKVGGKMSKAGPSGSYRMVRRGGKLVEPKREKLKKSIGKLGRKLVSAGERLAPAKKEEPARKKTTKALPGTTARKALPPAKEALPAAKTKTVKALPAAKTKTVKALPPAKTSARQEIAKEKLAKSAGGSSAKGVRFAGITSKQVAGQRAHTGRGEALEKHRKKAGIAEGFDIFDVVLEHLIENGYAETSQEALKIMANMREDERNKMIDEAEKWIQKAIKKPGALHKQLGVPEGEKIPAGKLAAAAEKGGKLGKRARLAQTLRGLG